MPLCWKLQYQWIFFLLSMSFLFLSLLIGIDVKCIQSDTKMATPVCFLPLVSWKYLFFHSFYLGMMYILDVKYISLDAAEGWILFSCPFSSSVSFYLGIDTIDIKRYQWSVFVYDSYNFVVVVVWDFVFVCVSGFPLFDLLVRNYLFFLCFGCG